MTQRRVFVSWLPAGLVLALPAVAEACPGCNAVIAERTSSLSAPLASGFYWSVLFLLATPFALVAVTTWLLIRSARRHTARRMLQAARLAGVGDGA